MCGRLPFSRRAMIDRKRVKMSPPYLSDCDATRARKERFIHRRTLGALLGSALCC